MFRSRVAFALLVGMLVGLWGCARSPSDSADKIKAVESKLVRLEDDFRAASSERDQLLKKLAAAIEFQTAQQSQLERLTKDLKDRDDLIQKRTAERDSFDAQFAGFRKNLRDLLAKAEEQLPRPEGSSAVPIIPTSNRKPDVAVPDATDIPVVSQPPK